MSKPKKKKQQSPIVTFVAALLAVNCLTAIVGLIPTVIGSEIWDRVIIETVTVKDVHLFGQKITDLTLINQITLRTAITFTALAAFAYGLRQYIAKKAVNITLSGIVPAIVFLLEWAFSFPSLIHEFFQMDQIFQPLCLWSLVLWAESLIVEAWLDTFAPMDLGMNAITSLGLSAGFLMVLRFFEIDAFSHTAYALLPLMAMAQFAVAKLHQAAKNTSSPATATPPST